MTTKTQALDHLTDVLAGQDVKGEQTIAGAIEKLASMIEDGEIVIGGGGGASTLVVNASYDSDTVTLTLDKTYAEIATAIETKPVVIKVPMSSGIGRPETLLVYALQGTDGYGYTYGIQTYTYSFEAATEDDYPSCYLGD